MKKALCSLFIIFGFYSTFLVAQITAGSYSIEGTVISDEEVTISTFVGRERFSGNTDNEGVFKLDKLPALPKFIFIHEGVNDHPQGKLVSLIGRQAPDNSIVDLGTIGLEPLHKISISLSEEFNTERQSAYDGVRSLDSEFLKAYTESPEYFQWTVVWQHSENEKFPVATDFEANSSQAGESQKIYNPQVSFWLPRGTYDFYFSLKDNGRVDEWPNEKLTLSIDSDTAIDQLSFSDSSNTMPKKRSDLAEVVSPENSEIIGELQKRKIKIWYVFTHYCTPCLAEKNGLASYLELAKDYPELLSVIAIHSDGLSWKGGPENHDQLLTLLQTEPSWRFIKEQLDPDNRGSWPDNVGLFFESKKFSKTFEYNYYPRVVIVEDDQVVKSYVGTDSGEIERIKNALDRLEVD